MFFLRNSVLFSFFLDCSTQNICRSTAKECRQNERIFYVYEYIDRVSKLFGGNLSSRPILVRIEFCRNVDAFNVWLHNHRPMLRIQQHGRNDFDFDYGLLYHDACSLNINLESMNAVRMQFCDVFAVEIKPKQGWPLCSLPEWVLELFEISNGLRNKCRFCAMQHLKVGVVVSTCLIKMSFFGLCIKIIVSIL